ncbi:isochorismatase family protein [Microbulbifer sp. ANSA001]|uniref:isochorismatase family protein n=1 Tax=Microbulbifer sp. ANSA001 TaxID=3243358 RepID=UPI004043069A
MNKYVETLTVDNSVLALVDHQTGLLVSCRDMDPHLMTQNIKGLTSLAKTVNMPTVVTASMPDGPNGPVMPEITDILGDEIIERAGEINAWKSAEFKRAIAATGRKKIIMAGIVTDVCLMFPAISAVAEGYDVYAVVDASGTWNNTVMQAAMHRMSQAGVKVATWSSVLAEIMDDWRSEHGMELGEILAQHTTYRWVYNSYLSATNQK